MRFRGRVGGRGGGEVKPRILETTRELSDNFHKKYSGNFAKGVAIGSDGCWRLLLVELIKKREPGVADFDKFPAIGRGSIEPKGIRKLKQKAASRLWAAFVESNSTETHYWNRYSRDPRGPIPSCTRLRIITVEPTRRRYSVLERFHWCAAAFSIKRISIPLFLLTQKEDKKEAFPRVINSNENI